MLSTTQQYFTSAARGAAGRAPAALLALLAGCTAFAPPSSRDEDYVIQSSVAAGLRSVDSKTGMRSADIAAIGVEVDWFQPVAILGYEVGVTYGRDKDAGVRTTFTEGYAGLRRTWLNATPITPYVGAGVSLSSADPNRTFARVESWGGYGHVGAYWELPANVVSFGIPLLLGLDVRVLVGDPVSYTEGRVFLGFRGP